MRVNETMKFPHPVLCEWSADYANGRFECSFEQHMTSDGELQIVSRFEVDRETLGSAIADQQASAGYYLVCRATFVNMLVSVPLGESSRFFDPSTLFGTVTLRPVIWTSRALEQASFPMAHPEFGGACTVPKGAVLGLGPEFRFSVDKQKFKPFESIFALARSEEVAPGCIAVDYTGPKIEILANGSTHERINQMRNVNAGKKILMGSVYFPTVVEVVTALQSNASSLSAMPWFRIFKAKCDDLGIDPTAPSESPIDVAQRLLKAPISPSLELAEGL